MFPPVTQRIAQNAIIGGAGSQQHGAPRHAAGSTHAGHGHVTWPRMARRVATHGTTSMPASLGALAAAVVGLPRATVGCRPPSDASPPHGCLPPSDVASGRRLAPAYTATAHVVALFGAIACVLSEAVGVARND